MDVVTALTRLGGVARHHQLAAATSRSAVRRALRAGEIVHHSRGTYHLAGADEAVARARSINGTLCLTSAALHHGWAVKRVPEVPDVAVPRGRKVSSARRAGLHLH